MSNEKGPERRHVLAMKIQADSMDELQAILNHIVYEFTVNGVRDVISGGYGSGYTAAYAENANVTHDSYFAEVDQWLEEHSRKDDDQ